MTFQTIASSAQKILSDNTPLILTGIGVAGVVTTAVLTGKATIKAYTVVLNTDPVYAHNNDFRIAFDTKDKIAATWKFYIPAAVTGIVTVGAVIASHQIGTRRAAAMAGAYVLAEKTLSEYKDKVADKFGETRAQAVKDEIAQDRVNGHPVTEESIVITNGGSTLCLEPFSMRYFNSSMEELKAAQNALNHAIIGHQYASLTELYNLIGLDRTQISDELGWNADNLLELTFTSTIASDGRPCLVMNYQTKPIRDYYLVH